MMKQPAHQTAAHAGGMAGHPGANPFALGPITNIHGDNESGGSTMTKEGPASNLRKRKTPPATVPDDDDEEDNLAEMPALQQSMANAVHDDPPQPRMTPQQPMMHPGHLHPPFHYPVPSGYVPVLPLPITNQGHQSMSPPDSSGQGGEGGRSGASTRILNGSKRAEQNRKAQRAFRERRDAHVKALESRSQLLETALASVDEANRRWEEARQMCESLRLENTQLRAALNAFQQAGTAIVQMQQLAQSAQQGQEEQAQASAQDQNNDEDAEQSNDGKDGSS